MESLMPNSKFTSGTTTRGYGLGQHSRASEDSESTDTASEPCKQTLVDDVDHLLLPPPAVDLAGLIESIPLVLRHNSAQHKELVMRWLAALNITAEDIAKYAHFDQGKKYTRNLIATDNETYTLMLLCWTAGRESPIHDHPCEGCWVRVISGTITETRYNKDEQHDRLVKAACLTASEGAVTYIDDSLGLHKVAASGGCNAMTLHVYSPPFRSCSIWLGEEEKASAALKPHVTYHSEYGQVLEYASCKGPKLADKSDSGDICQ